MSIYFLKALISFIMVFFIFVNVFTMFEVLGRSDKRYDVGKLKKIHRISGLFFVLSFLFVTYFCLRSIANGQMELSPRAAFHSVFALAAILLLAMKVSYIEIYRQFYGKVLIIGPVIALTALGMVATSGGYYLLVTKLHTDKTFDEMREYKDKGVTKKEEGNWAKIKTDPESIAKGKELFDAKCSFCHETKSNKARIGPGLMDVLKNKKLPVSKRPATPENIRNQLSRPWGKMPSFDSLREEEVADITAFLNTL